MLSFGPASSDVGKTPVRFADCRTGVSFLQKTSLNGQPREPGAPPRAREAHAKASGPKAGNTSPRGHRHPDNPHTGTGTDSGRRGAGESKKAASGRKSRASLSRRSKQGTARPRSRKAESRDTDTTPQDTPRSRCRDTPEPEHRGRPRSRDTRGNSKQNHKSTPKGQQVKSGRGTGTGRDTRHGLPRWPGHRQARPPLVGGICRPARGLPWPCRPGQRPAFPPAGGVPRAPPRANARGRRRLRRQCARRSQMRPPAGARAAAAARSRCPGSAGGRHPQRGAPGRYAGRRVRRQSRAAWPAPQAWPGWQGWPKRRRPGRRRGRPHSPHRVGAGPRRSTCAATGAGLAGGKAREAAPQGLGLAARLGGPAQRLAANLTGPGLPGLGRHISRTDPQGLAGRAAAPPPHRVGRVSGPQAAGAGGTRPARRRATDGSPFPQAAIPSERTKEGVPIGHSLLIC